MKKIFLSIALAMVVGMTNAQSVKTKSVTKIEKKAVDTKTAATPVAEQKATEGEACCKDGHCMKKAGEMKDCCKAKAVKPKKISKAKVKGTKMAVKAETKSVKAAVKADTKLQKAALKVKNTNAK